MKNIYEQHEIDLDILLSLREGKRKEVAKKISKTAERMRRDDNKEVIILSNLETSLDNTRSERYRNERLRLDKQ